MPNPFISFMIESFILRLKESFKYFDGMYYLYKWAGSGCQLPILRSACLSTVLSIGSLIIVK